MIIPCSEVEGDVLLVVATDVFAILHCGDPVCVLEQADSLVVATAAHRVLHGDVRHVAVGLHHKTQSNRTMDLSILGCFRVFKVRKNVLRHSVAVGEIGLGSLFKLVHLVDLIAAVGFQGQWNCYTLALFPIAFVSPGIVIHIIFHVILNG